MGEVKKEREEIYGGEVKKKYRDDHCATTYDDRRYRDLTGELNAVLLQNALYLSLAGIGQDETVLDAPCGTGKFLEFLVSRNFNGLGGDISHEMMGAARAKFHGRKAPEFVQFDLERMPFKDKSIPAMINVRFMVHVPADARVRILTEVNRVVKKRVVVCYYHKYYLSYILRSLKKMVGIGKSRRKNPGGRVGYADLMKETAKAGLKIRKVTPLAPIVSGNCVVEMQPTTRKAPNTKS